MRRFAAVLAVCVTFVWVSGALAREGRQSFAVNVADISGDPTGAVALAGGGHYDRSSGTVQAAGHFRCTSDIDQGPLTGCRAGEGVRWEAVELLSSTGFTCTGLPGEPVKTAVTDGNTIAMLVNFFREGDGADKSFTARMFISEKDEDRDRAGIQNVWIAGVGCGGAVVDFH